MKKKMQQEASTLLSQLTKCLSTCKREVFSLSPSLVRPDVNKIKDAVDNALFTAERIIRVSIKSTAALKTMTQTAVSIARVVYIPENMHSSATRSSYHKLLRIRRFLNLALRVATVLYSYTVKMYTGEIIPQASKATDTKASNCGSDGDEIQRSKQQDDDRKPQSVKKVAPSPSKGCSSKDGTSNSEQKPVENFKIPTSLGICNNSSNTTLSKVPVSPAKLKMSKYSLKAVFDDVVDVGVVMVKKPLRRAGYKPRTVDKQRPEATLRSVEKQSIFKASCNKNRFSPYAGRANASRSNVFAKSGQNIGVSTQVQSSVSEYCVISDTSLTKSVQSVARETSFNKPTKATEEQKHALPQLTKERQARKAPISMDELADLFGSKFIPFKTVNVGFLNLSFRDPGQHSLTSPVIPREKYPGVALQDGGVKFVLRESPLTKVLQRRKLEGKNLLILPQSMLNAPQSDQKNSEGKLNQFTPAQSMPVKTLFSTSTLLNKPEQEQSVILQSAQLKPKISMGELADMFETKCKISESVNTRSRLSFRDPGQHTLTSTVIPREQYPGAALQDGRVKFVLRESPLTSVLQRRKLEGKNLNILSQSTLNALRSAQQTPDDARVSCSVGTKSLTPTVKLLFSADVDNAAIMPAKRRLHSKLSNVWVARKKQQHACGELDEYQRIMGDNVKVFAMNSTEERPFLGKVIQSISLWCVVKVSLYTVLYSLQRTATEAGLPVPTAKSRT